MCVHNKQKQSEGKIDDVAHKFQSVRQRLERLWLMACRDGNEKQKIGSIGMCHKRKRKSLHFSGNKKMENMNFTKKRKICIIYAATERSLKAFMCLQSMKMASKKEKYLRTYFLLLWPEIKGTFDTSNSSAINNSIGKSTEPSSLFV